MQRKNNITILLILAACFVAGLLFRTATQTVTAPQVAVFLAPIAQTDTPPASQDTLTNDWGTIGRESPLSSSSWPLRSLRDVPVRQNTNQIDALRHLLLGFSAWSDHAQKELFARSAATVSPLLAGHELPIFLALGVWRN